MGIQEIKEEILSRKLRERAGEIRHTDMIVSEFLMSLSIKNYFLSETWEYARTLDIVYFSNQVSLMLKSLNIHSLLDMEDNFDQIMEKSIEWITHNNSIDQ